MDSKGFVNQCKNCGKNYTAYRMTSRFCNGNCRAAFLRETRRMQRSELLGFSDAEHEIADAIRTDSEVSYQLIMAAKRKSLFNGRMCLWTAWTLRYPDELLPQDIIERAEAALLFKTYRELDKAMHPDG